MWIESPVAGHPDGTKQRLRADRGHQLRRLLGRNQLDVQPDRVGPTYAPLLLHQLLAAGGEAQAADCFEDAQPLIELDAVATEPHHGGRWVELGDQPRRMTGRAAGQVGLFEQHRVSPARLCQVIGDAGAGDPAANDDGARTARQLSHTRAAPVRSSNDYSTGISWWMRARSMPCRLRTTRAIT